MSSIDLWFRASEVLEIAEHAMAATKHRPSLIAEHADRPALVWVKDDGTYLTSSGLPRQLTEPPSPDGWAKVAFAVGWGRGTGPRLGDTPVGGDDFAEHLVLTEPTFGDTTLIDAIRDSAASDGWLVITAEPGQFGISIYATAPPTIVAVDRFGALMKQPPR
ncbi:hypothetical protein BJY24_005693 [Nocardia transvalensis]|uniref:Uncharacterized protein n=1 Tax=Nocardia transvalensis TaxID=37333 RepID=A0A7W9PIH9_9NOCA|nr:hypothetical protein [Nocardia transvalensis]MBB5916781.1 hypothetical protein [Nocardia transvalensis]